MEALVLVFSAAVLIALLAFVFGANSRAHKAIAEKHHRETRFVCKSCGTQGAGRFQNKGSGGVELVLYGLGLLTMLIFLPVAIIYSVWRRSGKPFVCGACGSHDLVPPDSHAGKQILESKAAAV